MRSFRKYDKTYRIKVPNIPVAGRFLLDKKAEHLLINGKVTVTEKMDGANTAIYRWKGHTYLQKRNGNIDGSHPQYSFFKRWAYKYQDKIELLPSNVVVYGELMRCVHSVYYDKLPDWFLIFDIYDLVEGCFLNWSNIMDIVTKAGLSTVPLIYEGKTDKNHLMSIMPKESMYGLMAEGIVVKNYRQQVKGKIVKHGFIKTLGNNKHWMNREIKLNNVKGGAGE